jgi:SAM-dependent methyltransferase
LPCPPYGDPEYWNAAYLGVRDRYEWGGVGLQDVHPMYTYRDVRWDIGMSDHGPASVATSEEPSTSSLQEAIGIDAEDGVQRPILILGCGTSTFGEDMVDAGWAGPILQVDVSRHVVDVMTERCRPSYDQATMTFIQDDACELSAIRDGMVAACIDKGLVDAVYCADEDNQLSQIVQSTARVLRPGGSFVFFSFSRPEFLLPRVLSLTNDDGRTLPYQDPTTTGPERDATDRRRRTKRRQPWADVRVHQLDNIMLYRMKKMDQEEDKQLQPQFKFNRTNQRGSSSRTRRDTTRSQY